MTDRRAPHDLPLGPLGFGTASLGNLYVAISDEQAWDVLDAAWDAGIRYFDTAPHYGLGLAERRLGAFLRMKPRDEYVVSTKVGRLLRPSPATAGETDEANGFAVPASLRRVWDFSDDGVRRSLDESLERLGLASVDVLYLHDPEEFDLVQALRDGVPAVARLRDAGLVSAVGVGSKSTEALVAGVRSGSLDLIMIAGRLTLLEQPALDELVPECRERGVGIVAAGVFNSGLLSTATPRDDAPYEYGVAPAAVLDRARRLAALCREYGVDLPTAAIQFPLREESVRSVVVGAGAAEHIRQNVGRMQAQVPGALWERLQADGLIGP